MNADIIMDRDEKSKGMGEVQFEDPTDAIGAIGIALSTSSNCHLACLLIALFHGQMLFDRPMMVRMVSVMCLIFFPFIIFL